MKKLKCSDMCIYGLVCLFFAFTLCVFAPLEIYFTNISQFWFQVRDILLATAGTFVVIFAGMIAAFTIIALVSDKAAKVCAYILFVLGILIYLQGNFVVSTTGALDGRPVDWSAISIDRIESLILWVVGIAVGILVFVKCRNNSKISKVMTYVSVCIVLVEMVTLTTVTISNKSQLSTKALYYPTDAYEMDMSDEENVVIFVLDSFDSRIMMDILSEDDSCIAKLDGFTYYPDTLGCYNYTILAFPQIISGKQYLNQEVYNEFLARELTNCPLYSEMLTDGWNMGMYTEQLLPPCDFSKNLCNTTKVDKVGISSKRRFLEYIYRLVAYKYAPYELKQACWFDPSEYDNMKVVDDSACILFDWENRNFWDAIDSINTSCKAKVFKLYHLRGTHDPLNYDEYGNLCEKETSDVQMGKANILMLTEYIQALKDKGIYDKTAIIVMADHGMVRDDDSDMKSNPLLMIKGTSESHDMIVSDKQISYADLDTIYTNLMAGKSSGGIVSGIEDKERLFYWYRGNITIQDTHCSPLTEYSVAPGAQASDIENLSATGKVYQWDGE